MTIAAWPAELPILVDSFAAGLTPASVRQRMDNGLTKSRRRSRGPSSQTFATDGNANAMARLRRFWEDDTNFGVLTFTITDPMTDGEDMTDETGQQITNESAVVITIVGNMRAMFAGDAPPVPVATSPVWFKASIQLDIMPL